MSRITKRFVTVTAVTPNAVTTEGFPAYKKSNKTEYLQMLMTNTMGNTYYADREAQVVEALALHAGAIKDFPAFVGPAAVYARNKGYMRSQPIMAMAYLAKSGYKGPDTTVTDFEKYFDQVILTPNDLNDFLTFYANIGKGQGGRRLKRVVQNWLVKKLSAYWIIKYGSENKAGYSMKDILTTIHPKGLRSDYAEYLMRNVLPNLQDEFDGEVQKLIAFENFKKSDTVDDAKIWIASGRLPHEVVTPAVGRFPELWDTLVPNMPIFALLRNLATLQKHGVLETHKNEIMTLLGNPDAIAKSKILPFQFIKAFDTLGVKDAPAWLLDMIRVAVDLSVTNIPEIMQNVTIGLDVSGSMDGDPVRNGAILSIALAKKAESNLFYTFNDDIKKITVSRLDSLLTQATHISANHGTETALVGAQLLKDGEKGRQTDICILLTDEQQNAGRPFYTYVEKYRRQYNRNMKLFIIDVGAYASSGGLAPEGGLNYYVVGQSPRILDFITLAAEGFSSMVDAIEKGGM